MTRRDLRVDSGLVARFCRFIGAGRDEYLELAAFETGRQGKLVHVAYSLPDQLARHAEQAQRLSNYQATYILPNPVVPELRCRYAPGRLSYASNGRASDEHVTARRVLYVDVDPVSPVTGISATDDEREGAREAWLRLGEWVAGALGSSAAIASGCSGNGYYLLVAIELVASNAETTRRVERLLKLLARKFSVPGRAAVDASVANPARLMPFPGTWKSKGGDYPERPHRLVSFECAEEPTRVSLEALC